MNNSLDFKLTGGLLALALLVGGAGVSYPLLQLSLGTAAVLVAAYWVVRGRGTTNGPLDRWALALLGLTLLLPLVQLIPLPPAIWHALPGRSVPKEVDAILQLQPWRPWTLDVEGTVRSWLVLIPTAVIFVGCLRLDTKQRSQPLWIVAAFALLNACLGIVQLVTGGGATPYASTHSGDPIGFFVNRNHSAAIMLATMPVVAALALARAGRSRSTMSAIVAASAVIAVLTMVIIATTSRTGLLLLPVSLAVSLLLLFASGFELKKTVPALIALGILGSVLVTSQGFNRALDRFTAQDDPRFAYWTDIQWALQHYGLAGTGAGTFVPVFQSAESLEGVVPQVINHAHNDYLEILLDAGIPGALLFAAFVVLFVVAVDRGRRGSRPDDLASLRMASATGIVLLLIFSVVDYPLRMPAIAAVLSVLFAILLPIGPSAGKRSEQKESTATRVDQRAGLVTRFFRLAALVPIFFVWVVMLQAAVSARAIQQKQYQAASDWAFWSTRANAAQASSSLGAGNPDDAWRHAKAAFWLSPINAEAIRDLALIRMNQGRGDGHELMRIAAALGWRDLPTQFWTIEASQRLGEPHKALQRAEGLFRQGKMIGPTLQLLLASPDQEATSTLLAQRLAQRPPWREKMLVAVGSLPPADFARFKSVFAKLAEDGTPVSPDEMNPVLRAMVSRGRKSEAQALWVELNPTLLRNGEFAEATAGEDAAVPAGWDVPPQNRDRIAIARYGLESSNRALRAGPSDWVALISQELMLPGGTYTMSYDVRESGRAPIILRWQLRCQGSGHTQTAGTEVEGDRGWQRFTAIFDVPARDCPIQRLALRRVQSHTQSETWLDRIVISRNPAGNTL